MAPPSSVMTPSRHNRDLHHHTITPEYPIIDLRLPATVFDVYPTHLGTRTKSSCSWDEPLRPSMTACPKLSSTFHNQMVTTKDNRGSQGLNSYLWYLDPHLVAGKYSYPLCTTLRPSYEPPSPPLSPRFASVRATSAPSIGRIRLSRVFIGLADEQRTWVGKPLECCRHKAEDHEAGAEEWQERN